MATMMWRGVEIDLSTLGQSIDWSDDDIDAMLGIDTDGNIDPDTMEIIFAEAANYPLLLGLIEAGQDDGTE
jgi:hypothetical protein